MLKNTNKFFFSQQIYWFLPYSMGIISHNIYVIKIHGSQFPTLNVVFYFRRNGKIRNGRINSENVKSTEVLSKINQCTKTSILRQIFLQCS
jgi:hypothetical protein